MQDDLEHQLLKLLEEPQTKLPSRGSVRRSISWRDLVGNRSFCSVLAVSGKALAGLRSVGIEPLAFVDNNPALWGRFMDGMKVLQPAEAVRDFGNAAVFVVTLWNYSVGHPVSEIRRQLGEPDQSKPFPLARCSGNTLNLPASLHR